MFSVKNCQFPTQINVGINISFNISLIPWNSTQSPELMSQKAFYTAKLPPSLPPLPIYPVPVSLSTSLHRMMSSSNPLLELPEQLGYVQCSFCATILLVHLFQLAPVITWWLILQHVCVCLGECSMQQPVEGGNSSMRPLHWSAFC